MLFVPLPGSYAVVEIDVEKTLEPLNDPLASAAGALIKTTKCGVYLDMVRAFRPSPQPRSDPPAGPPAAAPARRALQVHDVPRRPWAAPRTL